MCCCLRPICYDEVWVFEEAAILESHGIEVQSPGGQSNSDEVDGNDFPDQVNHTSMSHDDHSLSRSEVWNSEHIAGLSEVTQCNRV